MPLNVDEQLLDIENSNDTGEDSVREAKRRAEIEKSAEEKKKQEEENSGGNIATKGALRWAWTTLIPSWGLSLVYINMHCFLRWVFPGAFCKLGDEWIPRIVTKHSSKNIAGTVFGIVEMMGLLILDIIAFFVIFAVIAIIAWLADNLIFKAGSWVLDLVA